ncbi:MAG: hypothetical protein LBS84_13620 [Clostridiales bacterium]|jgi:hypothetical protein|nr:hypothetical protein [Clostridiales bacterium]
MLIIIESASRGRFQCILITIQFSYANAATGTAQYVSCVLTSDDGNGTGPVAYYGKLADSSNHASGTLSIPMTGVADGIYTLQIFSEKANDDSYTDFCGTPVTATLEVNSGIAAVSDFSGATVTGVMVSPSVIEVERGTTQQFGATVEGTNEQPAANRKLERIWK